MRLPVRGYMIVFAVSSSLPVSAATVSLGTLTANCGAASAVGISIEPTGSESFSELDFQIQYDQTQLSFDRAGLPSGWQDNSPPSTGASAQIKIRPPQMGSYSGTIGTLVFKVSPTAKKGTTTAIQISNVLTFSGNIFVTGVSGSPGTVIFDCLQQQSQPPPSPLLTATAQSVSSVSLSWDAVAGATQYRLFRGSNEIYHDTATSYLDANLPAGTQFCYSVRAVAEVGESNQSPDACATTPPACTALATAPSISGSTEGTSMIRLSWSVVTGATAYRLLRGSTEIYRGTDQSFLDKGLSPSSQNCYSVQAISPCGNGPQSLQSCVTTAASCTPPANASAVTITPVSSSSTFAQWTAVPNATTYVLTRGTTEVYRGNQISFQDQALLPATQYCYTVNALNDGCGAPQTSSVVCARTAAAPTVAYYFAPFAGPDSGGPGSRDGLGAEAAFNRPSGVATDNAGNVYVADTQNSTIRKITPDGAVKTLAGGAGRQGSTNGIAAAARFSYPSGAAADKAGNVYVADAFNHTIRKVTPDGTVTTLAGSAGQPGSANGSGDAARFNGPNGVATDTAGNVYVADTINHTIRKITPDAVVITLAGSAGQPGSANGGGDAARFNGPSGVATDTAGNVYVADSENLTIRKITPDGTVSTLAAEFNHPHGVATDTAGSVYVADEYNHTIRKISPDGMVTTLAGTAGQFGVSDGIGASARFLRPNGVATDTAGNVYVADTFNHTIRKITADRMVTTLAGTAEQSGVSDGIGGSARFSVTPRGVATDTVGNVYVADTFSHTIRKITPDRVVTTLAGTAGQFGFNNGVGTSALFNGPSGVATDKAGNVYVADTSTHTIRKITPDGTVTTLAGNGEKGSTNGVGAAARFSYPNGLATDTAGNVYVADSQNFTIRKITPDGTVTTLAGTAGQPGSIDGVGAAARFGAPLGVATDSAGNIYVAEGSGAGSVEGEVYFADGNHTIRKIAPDGTVTTLAGSAGQQGSSDGVGTAARFYQPQAVATDSAGNVYVADRFNHTIRRITPDGVVTTLAGIPGLPGINSGVGSDTRFSYPYGIAIAPDGSIVISNSGSSSIGRGVLRPIVPPRRRAVK